MKLEHVLVIDGTQKIAGKEWHVYYVVFTMTLCGLKFQCRVLPARLTLQSDPLSASF